MKKEAAKTPLIEKYIRLKKIYGHIEVKHATGDKFYVRNFETQQLPGLEAAHISGVVVKLSDADPRLKVCDIISTPPGLPSYVVIIYPGVFFFINSWIIQDYAEKGMKSITLEKAREISVFEVKN